MGAEKQGAFTFVLHSHLPYCRRAGRWPHGEEWIHEAAAGTYLPLLAALRQLVAEGVRFTLTVCLTPVLVEQLADELVQLNLSDFIAEKIARAKHDIERFTRENDARLPLAHFYVERFTWLKRFYEDEIGRDIVGALRAFQDQGFVEIGTSAATHGYLPLLSRDSSIAAQVRVGVETYSRHFGRWPRSFWLPECAYRPPHLSEDGRYVKPGLEEFLAHHGILCFFAETHAIEGGQPVGKATGDALGPYGEIPRRYAIPVTSYPPPTLKTTYLPYWVQTPRVAVLGRNNRTGLQVWSAAHGYPGEFHYREFHRKDGISGLHYWAVTGVRVPLGEKALYNPHWAQERVRGHADHFSKLVAELLSAFHAQHGRPGIISAAYDTELFGHWWFEGVDWLREVLRQLAASDVVQLTSASQYIEEHPPEDVLALPESSWGQAGNHFTWLNADTEWMWPIIHRAEAAMEALVDRFPEATPPQTAALNQAARELLLLQASDWPFLVTTGQAADYAINRFEEHVARFYRLATLLERSDDGTAAAQLATELFELDKVFPDIDFRSFARREPRGTSRGRLP